MSARLARLALALYPLAYRRRYGEELAALVEDTGASPRVIGDLARGALSAHLRPGPTVAGAVGREDRLRLAASSVLLCWVLFTAAGLGLYKTTEGRPFEGGAGAPGLLGTAHLAIQILALLATAAVAIGAVPLVLAAWRQRRDRPAARRAIGLACGAISLLVGVTVGLVALAGSTPGFSAGVEAAILAAYSLLALACGVGCALAARLGLFAIDVPQRLLILAAGCATVVAVAMVGIVLFSGIYLVDLIAAAPDLAGEPNGPLGVPGVAVSLAIQLAAMVAFTAPTALAAARSWRAPARG
jgi:hypothetical protein